ncbi:hypothetical protein MRB53_009978 [Persea americana]|uniref:Uncharacterized protein n=1 Tax=Persea americana TaxID=3435 RepID=A0ACC2LQF7_PERAE|nr:hypothetical protein MRB53_009978 [Persea americana]
MERFNLQSFTEVLMGSLQRIWKRTDRYEITALQLALLLIVQREMMVVKWVLCKVGLGLYSASIKKAEKEIKEMAKKVNDLWEYDEKEHVRRGIDCKHSYEEHSGNETFEDVVVYKEPSMYDNLLMALGSSSKSMAYVYQRR